MLSALLSSEKPSFSEVRNGAGSGPASASGSGSRGGLRRAAPRGGRARAGEPRRRRRGPPRARARPRRRTPAPLPWAAAPLLRSVARSAGGSRGPRRSRAVRIFLPSQGLPVAPGGHGRPGAPVDTSTDDRRPAPARDRRGCFRQGPPVYATPAPGSTGLRNTFPPGSTGLRNTRRLILEGLPSQIRSRFEGGSELVSQGLI